MHLLVVAVLALLAALWQCGPLALWPVAPDLSAALAACLVVRTENHRLLLNLWVIGLIRDVVDPAATIVYAILFIVAAVGLIGADQRLRGLGLARVPVIAAILALGLRLAEIWWAGLGAETPQGLLLRTLLTAAVASGLFILMGSGRSSAPIRVRSVRTAVVE